MSNKSMSDWYRDRLGEIPGLEFQVEKKDSTSLFISTETRKFPSIFSIELSLEKGRLTLEAPLKIKRKDNLAHLLYLSAKINSYFAVKEQDKNVVPVIRMDRSLNQDFRLPKKTFHLFLYRFFSDHDFITKYFGNTPEKSQKNSSDQKSPNENITCERETAKVGFEVLE